MHTSDSGFTLIELMVVLLILAILLAIAIPTFLGVTKTANDRAAQSNLNTILVTSKAIYQTGGQVYGTAVVPATSAGASANSSTVKTQLQAQQPSLTFTTGAATAQGQVSVAVASDGQSIVLATPSKSTGNCFYVMDNAANQVGTGGLDPYLTLSGYTGQAMISGSNILSGTWYGESKAANNTPVTCNASAPTAYASATSQLFQSTGFPAL
jgi:type IV pilus assembly protein PilA